VFNPATVPPFYYCRRACLCQ